LSLESPRKRLSQSYVWLDQGCATTYEVASSVSEFNAKADVATSALELEISRTDRLPLTPARKDHDEFSDQEAPPRLKKLGRNQRLTRYFHQYECEDFMEYAVDIFDWKKSLEVYICLGSGKH